MKITYNTIKFSERDLATVAAADYVLETYARAGFKLTVRQLYWRLVETQQLAERSADYKRLRRLVSDGQLAGRIDWDHVADAWAPTHALTHWKNIEESVTAGADVYREDLWSDQPTRVQVWLEDGSLVGTLRPICDAFRVPLVVMSPRMTVRVRRQMDRGLLGSLTNGQQARILHISDLTHPLSAFDNLHALPEGCRSVFACSNGQEIAAMDPRELVQIVGSRIEALIDGNLWNAALDREERAQDKLKDLSAALGMALMAPDLIALLTQIREEAGSLGAEIDAALASVFTKMEAEGVL